MKLNSLKFFFIVTIILFFNVLNAIHIRASESDDKSPKKVKKKNLHVSLLSVSQKVSALKNDENFYSLTGGDVIAGRWQPIISRVREGKLDRVPAIDSMNRFTNNLWDFMQTRIKAGRLKKYPDSAWVFPVKGYTSNAIGGHGGSGYIAAGFDFFEVNSGGHPAHDIFINDANQDCIDDFTGNPVKILSMSGGIVIETRTNWTPEMNDIRGGNIVYVYDNYTNGLFYYAHMKNVLVKVGDFVQPGTELGTMGRTGKNAYPSRSPTHLHIMYVRSFEGEFRPENIYPDLLKAKVIE